MNQRHVRRCLMVIACATVPVMGGAPAALAEPSIYNPEPTPYPDHGLIMRSYEEHAAEEFFTASAAGVWFTSPAGLNCGIWDRGSFGCAGNLGGRDPGDNRVGWVNGNIVVRHDPLLGLQFPPGQAERTLPPHSYVSYSGTMCAITGDMSTYCVRGPYQFFVTPNGTWLSPT
ncbi:hypothetical protein [Mycobacterium vicinigordonae]|uniref:Secreted protein n=1 Tax=Mycobacterium vicinigordonae TaxID=1719132 RepID=A0A7D6HSC2_9MYCO|nr:hypothetical protein [Mycobacterium vicinigordonae]QLL08711.1 hypothetical protein H0P51_07295 [Mycobacterium vicinigordonae]